MPHEWVLNGAKNPYQTSQYYCSKCGTRRSSFEPPDPNISVVRNAPPPAGAVILMSCEEATVYDVQEG